MPACIPRTSAPLVVVAVALGLILGAPPPAAHAMSFDAHGRLDHRFHRLEAFPLDGQGTPHAQRRRQLTRLWVGGRASLSREFWIRGTLQLLDGQTLGDVSPVDAGPFGTAWRGQDLNDHLFLRELVLQVPIGLGVGRVGRMPVHWGLGAVVSDGEHHPTLFATPLGGDIVNGLELALKPLLPFVRGRLAHAVRLELAAGLVERDGLTRRRDGDLGLRFSGALRWEEPWLQAGVLVVLQDVRRDDGSRVKHALVDAAFRFERALSRTMDFSVAAELAYIGGSTQTAAKSTDLRRRADVRQVGAIARAELTGRDPSVVLALETGYASGDDQPLDGTDRAFRFDTSRPVGMILFREVLPRVTARARDRAIAADPTGYAAADPALLPTDGAVTSAVYLAPTATWSPWDGVLTLQAGLLSALTPEPLTDPAAPTADGPQNAWGAPAEAGYLGTEFAAGAHVAVALPDVAVLAIAGQGGVFLPGPALEGSDGGPSPGTIHLWRLDASIRW